MPEYLIHRTAPPESYAPGQAELDEGTMLDLSAVAGVLRRAWKRIAGAAFTCVLIAILVSFLLPTEYTSSASFIPPAINTGASGAAALAGQLAGMGVSDLLGVSRGSGDLYAGILRSRSIASEIVKRFDLMAEYKAKKETQAESKLASNTSINIDAKAGIITLEVTDRNPARARDLANAYLEALREKNGNLALSQSSQRKLFFEQQLANEKDQLEDAEVALKKTQEESGLIAPSGQTESEIRTIATTQAGIAAREVQLAALRQSATEQNPDVIRLQSEISDLRGQLERLQNGSKAVDGSIPTSKVPELQLEYVRREREVKYHEALFEILSKQYEAARLDESRDAPVLQILDPASYPDTRSSPKRTLIAGCGLLLGLIAGCAWALAGASLRSRLTDSEEASQRVHAPFA